MPIDALRGTIGLVTSSLDADYGRRLVAGATEVLIDNGYSPICFSPGASGTSEYQIPLGFLELVAPEYLSGLIFTPPSIQFVAAETQPLESTAASEQLPQDYDIERFQQRMGNLPAVCVGAGLAGMPGVWVQNGAGIRLLMKRLTDVCGRRRIAFIRGPQQNVEAKSRFQAWEDFCIEYSLPHGEELVELGDFTPRTGEAATLRILEKNSEEPPDAFLASNDRMAIGVLQALRAKGLSVPKDVSVVGFDDLEAENADPALTTIRQPVFEMGQRAAEVLIAMLRKEPYATEHMFAPELIVRASCQPNQQVSANKQASLGIGASVFLESAYPSAELLMPLLRGPRRDSQKPPSQFPVGAQLAGDLETGLRRARARERDLIAGVRRMRARAIEQLDQALSAAKSLQELHSIVVTHLHFIGLQGLTLALLSNQDQPQSDFRLAVDCSVASDTPLSQLGARLAGGALMTAQARRKEDHLRVIEPLYSEGKYCGFLIAGGTLLDNQLLAQLGTVLTRAAARIGK